MRTFIMMTRLAPQDAHLVEFGAKSQDRARNGRAWLDQIKKQCPEVRFLAHYALFGQWDFMDIYEAPDEEIAAKVSLLGRAHGAHQVESWLAIPYEKILKITEDIRQAGLGDS